LPLHDVTTLTEAFRRAVLELFVKRSLDDASCTFFRENGFLIGISVDGPAPLHDAYRVDKGGKATHGRVLAGLELMKNMTRLREIGYADVGDFIDHVDHAVDLIGIDHVGLSSDFDGGGGIVDWFDAGETFNVTLELVRRGYSRDNIEKLWGGNLLRVWREVEEVAAESG
jgi:microsomal dipeptidase-like Zn-dependent dipeptidase